MPIKTPNFLVYDGHLRQSECSFNGPPVYPTGGEPITAHNFGLNTFSPGTHIVGLTAGVPTHNAYLVSGINTGANGTLGGITDGKIFITTLNGTQVTNGTDLSAVLFYGVVNGH